MDVLEVYFERLTSTIYLEIEVEIFVNGKSFTNKSTCQSVWILFAWRFIRFWINSGTSMPECGIEMIMGELEKVFSIMM